MATFKSFVLSIIIVATLIAGFFFAKDLVVKVVNNITSSAGQAEQIPAE